MRPRFETYERGVVEKLLYQTTTTGPQQRGVQQ